MIDQSNLPLPVLALFEEVETNLRTIEWMVDEGVLEWTEEHENLLLLWRRCASGTGEWEWWGREIGGETYYFFGDTREQVIAAATAELGEGEGFEIIEACCWQDEFRVEASGFAEITRRETIEPGA